MPRFRLGLLADIQYADAPNGVDFTGRRTRYYRHGLEHLKKALHDWNVTSDCPSVDLIVNFGDHLDGLCTRLGQRDSALTNLSSVFSPVRVPVYHLVGNHDLYNFTRQELASTFLFHQVLAPALHLAPAAALKDDLCYFAATPTDGFRLLVLDAYDVSVLGRDAEDARFVSAYQQLVSHNHNENINSPEGVEEAQYVAYNGGIGEGQLAWIEEELQDAKKKRQVVIVFCHVPVHPSCSYVADMKLWNWETVNALLDRYADVVKLVLVGHTHTWQRGVSQSGIIHCALPGLVETPPDQSGVGILELGVEEIRLLGNGGLIPDMSIELTRE